MPSPIATDPAEALPALLRPSGAYGQFANDLLAAELPDLPDVDRALTVDFVCRRAAELPSPLLAGVLALSVGVGAGQRLVGRKRMLGLLRQSSLPFVGELGRMVRSLGFAFVWETWPDSSPTGART